MEDNQDPFDVLRKINSKPKSSQRELARELGFSLGKLNYCRDSYRRKTAQVSRKIVQVSRSLIVCA